MQVEEITQILRESPSVRLIKSRSVDFFLSFVIEAFEGQAAIMQERLHMLLENRLDEQENTLVFSAKVMGKMLTLLRPAPWQNFLNTRMPTRTPSRRQRCLNWVLLMELKGE